MKLLKRKSGFTLMELMVYIAILSIVVLIAGQAFTDSTRFRIRTQNMLKATQVAENVGNFAREYVMFERKYIFGDKLKNIKKKIFKRVI